MNGKTARGAQVAWAKYLGETSHEKAFPLTKDGKVTVEMCLLPPGKYYRGSPAGETWRDNDETQAIITLTQPLWVSRHEVTQMQYAAVMGKNPSRFKKEGESASLYPVETVTHDDCVQFTKKASAETGAEFRLLNESEWEYAYRAGTQTSFYNGNSEEKLSKIAHYARINGNPEKVGSKLPNAFGLYDMAGNVWEWCSDWYADNYDGTITDLRGPSSGSERVIRGGSWSDSAGNCRAANRYRFTPTYSINLLGLRLARVPSSSK